MGSLLTDLLRVEEGIYIVKAQVIVNNTVLGSGIAGSNTVEEAEDAALKRALNHAGFGRPSMPLGLGMDPSGRSAYLPTPDLANGHASSLPIAPEPIPAPIKTAPIKTEPTPSPGLPGLTESGADMDDLSDIIAQTDVELQRIGWSNKEGREFLESRFHKKSRHQLTDTELREFLRYLKQQPPRLNRESGF
ncbi:hypothetical protein [Thermostichus vulcanus]|uniref:DRBM domain-containing protein n=1 Tax=Thermostichus vulcanus str. 'Rupite' TaxID=2813851 RepID=A0ABT0CDY9_THEVL|nr:hypothetical protein [Thermostichus vulcanus]MCJ2543992.1 hypothetical protein [Thermostichus vulcanus str. 'Rupite']